MVWLFAFIALSFGHKVGFVVIVAWQVGRAIVMRMPKRSERLSPELERVMRLTRPPRPA